MKQSGWSKRAGALVLAAALALGMSIPASAQKSDANRVSVPAVRAGTLVSPAGDDEPDKTETVTVKANPDGTARKITVETVLKQQEGVHIPSERTVYRVMDQIGLSHRPKRKPNGLTKADREAMKSDDLLKRDFHSDAPLEKCITDITEIPARNGKLYVSAIFDCFDLSVLGLSMGTNMKADLCIQTLENALTAYPALEGAIIHSDRGTQYTSESYRQTIREHHIHQSMNSAGGRCHDNARCESMWAKMKTELLYDRYDTRQMTVEELKALIWRYFLSYWNNRRICSANGGLPPLIKRRQYYEDLELVA